MCPHLRTAASGQDSCGAIRYASTVGVPHVHVGPAGHFHQVRSTIWIYPFGHHAVVGFLGVSHLECDVIYPDRLFAGGAVNLKNWLVIAGQFKLSRPTVMSGSQQHFKSQLFIEFHELVHIADNQLYMVDASTTSPPNFIPTSPPSGCLEDAGRLDSCQTTQPVPQLGWVEGAEGVF